MIARQQSYATYVLRPSLQRFVPVNAKSLGGFVSNVYASNRQALSNWNKDFFLVNNLFNKITLITTLHSRAHVQI